MIDSARATQPFLVAKGEDAAAALRGAVVTIGNFDGVHRGHRAAIAAAIARANSVGRPAAALTFEPHPRSFFHPETTLYRLSSEANKVRLLALTGLDGVIILPFDRKLATMPALSFIDDFLVGQLDIAGALIGPDFLFGAKRLGTPALLRQEGDRRGFSVEVVPDFAVDGMPVSSRAIREALIAGDIATATAMLGYPWLVTGRVEHGEKRGRDLGFPTANISVDPSCRLRHGIYAVRVGLGARRLDGVASFGRRPTFDNGRVLLEVCLFDFAGDLYGRDVDVAFVAFIRDELKFDSVDALIARMHDDSLAARAALAADPEAFPPVKPLSGE